MTFLNLLELEAMARDRVDDAAFDYVAGGAGDERTLEANRRAWSGYELVHRVLRDVSDRSTATTVLGTEVGTPVLVAPTAFHQLMHADGEEATARGADRAGTIMVASTLSTTPLEAIAEASSGPKWFQLYVYRDRGLTEDLIDRAEAAGYEAIVVTVDAPVWGRRERDLRHGFGLPEGMTLANFDDLDRAALPDVEAGADGLAEYVADQIDPSLTWEELAWVQERTDLPVLVKGVVHPDDARKAAEQGCAGVVVSNHGGRQLDAGVGTADALAEVAEAVGDDVEVLVDGGVRRGTDVLTALALGADAVLVGRPVMWSLAVDGADGVARAIELLTEELDNAMALVGRTSVDEVDGDVLRRGR